MTKPIADYLRDANEALIKAGEDGYLLRVESKRVWTTETTSGSDVLADRAHGDLADVTLDGENITGIKPKFALPYGVASILAEALNGDTQ